MLPYRFAFDAVFTSQRRVSLYTGAAILSSIFFDFFLRIFYGLFPNLSVQKGKISYFFQQFLNIRRSKAIDRIAELALYRKRLSLRFDFCQFLSSQAD